MNYLHTSVHLDGGDIDRADIYTVEGTGGELYPIVSFGDGLSVMPSKGENLAGLLRLLADRIDAAMADHNDPGPILLAVA